MLTPAPGPPVPLADGPADPPLPAAAAPRRILPIERLGALIEVILCSGLPTQLLVIGALTGFGMSPRTSSGSWSPQFIAAMSLIDTVLVLGLINLFLRAHGESVRGFVLGRRRALREAVLGIALVPAAFMLVLFVLAVILSFAPQLHNVPVSPFQHMLATPGDAALFALVVMVAGGVREEAQRGFIVRRFDGYLGGGVAGVLVFSVAFGAGHIDQGYAAAIATGVLGAAWGFLYLSRGSIVAPMISHAGFNLAQLLKFAALPGQ